VIKAALRNPAVKKKERGDVLPVNPGEVFSGRVEKDVITNTVRQKKNAILREKISKKVVVKTSRLK
jgi:hypothetical protein